MPRSAATPAHRVRPVAWADASSAPWIATCTLLSLQVADMLNPEYYVGEYRRPDGSWATAKFADQVCGLGRCGGRGAGSCGLGTRAGLDILRNHGCPTVELARHASSACPMSPFLQLDEPVPEGAETRIAERRPLLLVPVPAESGWAAAPHAAAARASLAALQAGGAAAAGAGKRPREDGAAAGQAEEELSMSMMVSDATGQTAADDGDSAASRARRAAGAPAAQQQEASSGGAAAAGADLPAGCCMAYVSAGTGHVGTGSGWLLALTCNAWLVLDCNHPSLLPQDHTPSAPILCCRPHVAAV